MSGIVILDYGMGNIQSIKNALAVIGENPRLVSSPDELGTPAGIILPGVGAFEDGIQNLRTQGFIEPLEELVLDGDIPYLGLCLGFQFLAERSHEHGTHDGFGWIPAEVTRIVPDDEHRVPHMGWNETNVKDPDDSVLFDGFDTAHTFYYVHSFCVEMEPEHTDLVAATAWHGTDITAAARKENIFGVQFHPEKSQSAGLRLLENFVTFATGGSDNGE